MMLNSRGRVCGPSSGEEEDVTVDVALVESLRKLTASRATRTGCGGCGGRTPA